MSDSGNTLRPRRSVLYMPGANERALEKAKTLETDALILDLEDAVAPDAKAQACADAKKYGAEVVGRMGRVLNANQLAAAQEWAILVVDGCEPSIAARAALKGK